MSVTREVLGLSPEGKNYERFILRDENTGAYVALLNLGCILQEIFVPDRNGVLTDVAVGYDTAEEYAATHSFFGAVLGRFANRIGGGKFSIDGKEYHVTRNDRGGLNTLHGGAMGFHTKVFDGTIEGDTVVLKYVSPDGEEGFPGEMVFTVKVTFKDCALHLDYSAVCDRDTVANFSNHSFFNLNGQGNGDTLGHYLQLNCDCYCPCDESLVPTGVLHPVEGTPFDFREPKLIGTDIHADDPMITGARGYDLTYAVNGERGKMKLVAKAWSDESGITMDTYSDLPALQLYTGNVLGMFPFVTNGKRGAKYVPYGGFCLETENFPNAMNTPEFCNNVVLRAGETVSTSTVYAFGVKAQ